MIADSTVIKFACTHCGQRISIDAAGAGMTATCPNCSQPLVVPKLGSLHHRTYGEDVTSAPSRSGGGAAPETNAAVVLRELREKLAETECARGVAEASLAMIRRENVQLVERIGRLSAECGQRVGDGAVAAQKLAQREQELAASVKSAGQLSVEISARETELSETRARLAASEAAAERAREEVGALTAQNAEWRQKLAAAVGAQDVDAMRAALAGAEEKLTAEQSARAAAETQRNLRAGQCLLLQEEIARLRNDLAEGHAGRELLALRDRFEVLESKHQKATAALENLESAHATLTAAERQLRTEARAARACAAAAENRAEASTDSALARDIAVLRGIIERQKAELEERFVELRRVQRARLVLRIVYAVFALAFLVVLTLIFL